MEEIIDLFARERFIGYVVKFFQTIALPKEILPEELGGLNQGKKFGNLKYINQWRIDYPENIKNDISKEHKTILSIAHKILTRGDYTTVSPFLEEKLGSIFRNVNKGDFNPSAYELTTDSNNSTFWFDSEVHEKKFYEKVLPQILGSSFKRVVLPQVEFQSLVHDESKERVDFLITSNKSKIVVELDGEEHQLHKSKDYSRTKRLYENGFTEIRIRNSDLDNSDCKGIQELRKKFGTPQFEKYKKGEYDKYLNSVKLAHQFQITLVELLFEGILNDTDRCKISYDFDFFLNEYAPKDIRYIIEEALSDLKEFLSKLSELYDKHFDASKLQIVENNKGCILITYNENIKTEMALCIIQDISFPKIIAKELKSVENLKIEKEPNTELLEFFLKYIFGNDSFREGQLDSIKRVLLNKDTITLLPTGAGKSLIFQLATLLLPGVAVIIVPIKSLMHDQVENLEKRGISRAIGLSGDSPIVEREKVQRLLSRGQYLFIYVAPERFLIDKFKNSLREFTKKYIVSIIVIDEAHCVSEWGHDFRTAYLTIGKNSRLYCKNKDGFVPPIIALTGTASENVLLDIKEDLDVKDDDAVICSETFDRKELHFNIYKCNTDKKYSLVKDIFIKELPEKLKAYSYLFSWEKIPGSDNKILLEYLKQKFKIEWVKAAHITNPDGKIIRLTTKTNHLSLTLNDDKTNVKLEIDDGRTDDFIVKSEKDELKIYTNSLFNIEGKTTKSGIIFCPNKTDRNPRGVKYNIEKIKKDFGDICKPYYSDENERIDNARNFQENKFPLLIATKGYGMGIDKPNIRYIIHINLPPSVEAYYQEAGRAGRDKEPAECFIIYSCASDKKNSLLMDSNTSLDTIKKIWKSNKDDLNTFFFFHTNTFKGKEDELNIIKGILNEIGDLTKDFNSKFNNIDSIISNPSPDELLKAKQKAIFRLTAIGVISNYSIDYGSNEFSLTIKNISKETVIVNYFNYVKKYNHRRAEIERKELENKTDLEIKDFIIYCCELFLNYVYDYYEKGRRQALSTMLDILEKSFACNDPDKSNKLFREEISNFLKRTYSKQLLIIANAKDFPEMKSQIIDLLELEGSNQSDSLIKPVSDLRSLNSQISRTMEDFPESIGLFLLRAYVRLRINEADENLILNDINHFLSLSFDKYKFSKKEVYPLLSWLLIEMVKIRNIRGRSISKGLINKLKDDDLTIRLIRDFDKDEISQTMEK